MNVIDWEYYNSHFPKISEEEFNKNVYSAERFVLKKLSKTFNEYNASQQTDIKDCICNIINYQATSKKYEGISSVSNDGYSVSYSQNEESNNQSALNSILNEWIGSLIEWYVAF